MKNCISIILFLLFPAGISFAQDNNDKISRQILGTAEQAPEFPGGSTALYRFLTKNLHYPKKAYKNDVQGKVIVRFVVETNGYISNPEIIQSLDPDCDKETMRVIQKMPRWNPGRQEGAAVAVYYVLPVSFKL